MRAHSTAKVGKSKGKETKKMTAAERSAMYKRMDARALSDRGVHAACAFIKLVYDPQTGISTKGNKPWSSWYAIDKGFASPSKVADHVRGKAALAVTWGPRSRARVLDADAHGTTSPARALSTIWRSVRALHKARGVDVPDLDSEGRIDPSTRLQGVVYKTPGGYHYLEIAEDPTSPYDNADRDRKRVVDALAKEHVSLCASVIELLPGTNGQSRVPFGKDFAFVYPTTIVDDDPDADGRERPAGHVYENGEYRYDTWQAVQDMWALCPRVPRTFEAKKDPVQYHTLGVPQLYEGGTSQCVGGEGVSEDDEIASYLAYVDSLDDAYFRLVADGPEVDATPDDSPLVPTRAESFQTRHREVVQASKNGSQIPSFNAATPVNLTEYQRTTWLSSVIETWEKGADHGQRNRQLWDLVFALRCTYGWTRTDVLVEVSKWIEDRAHRSSDLSDRSERARRVMIRLVEKHMDRIDERIKSGRYYVAARPTPSEITGRKVTTTGSEPLLLHAVDVPTLEAWKARGEAFLFGSMELESAFVKAKLPALAGAIFSCARGGRIVLPAETLKTFAGTRKAKRDRDGTLRPAYKVLLSALERVGIVVACVRDGNVGRHQAAMYEVNSDQRESDKSSEAEAPQVGAREEAEASHVQRSEPGGASCEGHLSSEPVMGLCGPSCRRERLPEPTGETSGRGEVPQRDPCPVSDPVRPERSVA